MKKRLLKKRSKKVGLAPGTLIFVGRQKVDTASITVLDYDKKTFTETQPKTLDECLTYKKGKTTTWINVDGIHDSETIQAIGKAFGIHQLVLEDIMNTDQRPKIEEFNNYLFIILKMLYISEESQEFTLEQVSLILGDNYVISFQEKPEDTFGAVRERIRGASGRIRESSSDYLVNALIDAIVDNYFSVLERFGDKIEILEETLLKDPNEAAMKEIYHYKREMILIRKAIWPLREVISTLQKTGSFLVREETKIYLRDIHDHTVQIMDIIESFREILSSMMDIYLSTISNRMNAVMKILTIFAVIFIPLTFIVGVYGMNFENMPELKWAWGYPTVWGVMIVVTITMVGYFKRKNWL